MRRLGLFLACALPISLLACGGDDATVQTTPDATVDDTGAPDGARPSADAGRDAQRDATGGNDATSGSDATAPDASGADAADGATPIDAGSVDAGSADAATDATTQADAASADAGSDAATQADASDAAAATDAADAAACSCPTGFTCGAAGYCVNANGVPAFGHVYVIVMENHSLSSILGSSSAPYVNSLMTTYSYATAYTNVTHPSLPNYIAMTSGDTQGIGCDCAAAGSSACTQLTCNLILNNCTCDQNVTHLGDQLDGAGIAWREYAESAGTPCNLTDDSANHYAVKHVPFLYYDDVQTDAARCASRVRDYGDFSNDLGAGSYRFSYISPNLCDDMHDACGGDAVKNGDDWLKTNAGAIVSKLGPTDVLFIVWDEQDNSLGSAPIPLVIVSPLVKPKSTTGSAYNHYSLLGTIEQGFGLAYLGQAGTPIDDVWR